MKIKEKLILDEKIIKSVQNMLILNYCDNPTTKILQIWQEKDEAIYATIQIDNSSIHLFELINEISMSWLFIAEDEKFLVVKSEVRRIIYELPNPM